MQLTQPRFRPQRARLGITLAVALLATGAASAMALALHVDGPSSTANVQNEKPVPIPSRGMKLIDQVKPKYPPDARAKKLNGTVVLHVIIGKDGRPQSLQVLSGPKEFYASAIDAVQHWRWEPLLVQGRPVEVDTHISVNYAIF